MTRSSPARFLACVLGLSASLTAPAVSFAHGHMHREAAEHAADHATPPRAHGDHPAFSASDHQQDHGHPRLQPAAFSRMANHVPALRADAVTIPLTSVEFRDVGDAPEANESPPGRRSVSPEHSRAPPTL